MMMAMKIKRESEEHKKLVVQPERELQFDEFAVLQELLMQAVFEHCVVPDEFVFPIRQVQQGQFPED